MGQKLEYISLGQYITSGQTNIIDDRQNGEPHVPTAPLKDTEYEENRQVKI